MKNLLKAALIAAGLTTFVAPAFADFGIKGISDKAKAEANKSKDDANKNAKKTSDQMKNDAKDGANKEKGDAKAQAKQNQKDAKAQANESKKDAKAKSNDTVNKAIDNVTQGGDGKGNGTDSK